MLPKLKVLFLCTGNACRSQMAEGWARHLHGERLDPHSAGTAPASVDPHAVEVMAEVGVDLSQQRSKHIDEVAPIGFHWVITLCDHATESCPIVPGEIRCLHVGFDDPPRLVADAMTGEQALNVYRRVRDEIRALVETLPAQLESHDEEHDR